MNGTERTSWVQLLPRVLSLASALINRNEDGTSDNQEATRDITREVTDLAARVWSLGEGAILGSGGVSTITVGSGWTDLVGGSGLWIISLFITPIVVSLVIWYLVTTFILRKNILGRDIQPGSEVSGAEAEVLKLTARVVDAVEQLR